MRRAILRLTCLSSLVLATGCGTGSVERVHAGGMRPAAATPRPARDYISTEEVRSSTAQNAYDAIRALRASWLTRKRGEQSLNSPTDIVVYYNNARMGGLESLRQLSLGTVTWMRFYDAASANFRWGTGHSQGVILVSTESERAR